MTEDWRIFFYPLGFFASVAFGLRFLIQWLDSEIQQKSVVNRYFWITSIVGNSILWLHSAIQLQFHLCVIQICNGVIAWRNLNLMQPVEKQVKRSFVYTLFLLGLGFNFALFLFQDLVFGETSWLRTPCLPGYPQPQESLPIIWHLFGSIGIIVFSIRFWVQWWDAEQQRASSLSLKFWWMSLIGSLMTILYFIRLFDPVNLVGPLFGAIPYIRNLILIHKASSG